MERRIFLKNTVLSAIAISTTGYISFDGNRYVGNCETTSDVLGPFYRPDSPVRESLVIKGEKGDPILLFGKIKHNDCTTPYKNAKIELWHCDGNGIYDNESADFKYRGTTFSDKRGNYSFKTILPVPYGSGENYRPAHFHLMITAPGYQPLVTQLYFTGDPWIEKDSSASSPAAKRRILGVQTRLDGTKKVKYTISMSETLAAEPSAIDRLAGIYTDEKDSSKKTELFRKDNVLWIKGDPFGFNLDYVGHNTFKLAGVDESQYSFTFDILASGTVKMTASWLNEKGEKEAEVALREK